MATATTRITCRSSSAGAAAVASRPASTSSTATIRRRRTCTFRCSMPSAPRSSGSRTARARSPEFSLKRSETEPQAQLQRPWRVPGTARALHAVGCDTVRVAGVIEHVEEVGVDPQPYALFDRDHLEQGSVLAPLQNARPPLVHERVEDASEIGGTHCGAVFQWHPH